MRGEEPAVGNEQVFLSGCRSHCQEWPCSSEPSFTGCSRGNTFTMASPDKNTCVRAHAHNTLSLSNSPRCLNLAFPLCQVLTVLSFCFYHVCLLHPPKSDCLGILNPYKEQMSHPVESSFLFKPRMRTVSVMVSFSPSFWLKIHP